MVKMNKPAESAFGINIEDRFDPLDDHTVELIGMEDFQGISKIDGKPFTSVKWVFRVFDADGVSYVNLIDGGAYELWVFTSLSLSAKSNGRAYASALLGHELTDDECDQLAESFDDELVGKRARASWKVEEDPTTKNKRLKIALLRPLKATRAPSAPKAPTVVRDPAPDPEAPQATNGAATAESLRVRNDALRAQLAAQLAELDAAEDAPF